MKAMPLVILLFLFTSSIFSQNWWTPTNFEMDSMACVSVSLKIDSILQLYSDSTHFYINTGLQRLVYSSSVVKSDSDYKHIISTAEGTAGFYSPSDLYIPNGVLIENIAIMYEENAIHVTWTVPDTMLASRFHIFYAEKPAEYIDSLDAILNWGMTYDQVWELEMGVNTKQYYFLLPKKEYPAYTSLIRIGVMAEYLASRMGRLIPTYSKVYLAPDIVNKYPQTPQAVRLNLQ